MKTTTSTETIAVLRNIFATHGLPVQVVTDNCSQFISKEFAEFVGQNGIKHVRSSPYHPASNGQAERVIQILKSKLKAMKDEPGSLSSKVSRFLLSYRSTPHSTTGESPAELFIGRKLRTRLSLLKPQLDNSVFEKQAKQKETLAGCSARQFQEGDLVWSRKYKGQSKWTEGIDGQKE